MNAYLLSAIAVVGTLLGAVVAGTFQYLQARRQWRWQDAQAKRQLRWQATEGERRHLDQLEYWARAALEDRHKTLWGERRALYATFARVSEAYIVAIKDLRGATRSGTLPEGLPIASRADALTSSPAVRAWVEARDAFIDCLHDMEVLAHERVLALAQELHLALIKASRAALDKENENQVHSARVQKLRVLRAMRETMTLVEELRPEGPLPHRATHQEPTAEHEQAVD